MKKYYLFILLLVELVAQTPRVINPSSNSISGGGADPCTAAITNIPSGLHCTTVTLQKADIMALDITPFVLVPAPGAGLVIFPTALRWRYNAVTTPYKGLCTGTQYIAVWWENNANAFSYIFPPNYTTLSNTNYPAIDNLSSTVANYASGLFAYTIGNGSPVDPVAYTNKPIVLEFLQGVGQIGCFNFGTPITSTPVALGSGYKVNDLVSDTNENFYKVLAVNGSSGVTSVVPFDVGDGTPGTYSTTNVGNAISATISAGGNLYANGNTGTISGCGDGAATYTIVGSGGGVVSSVSVDGGQTYTTHSNCTTTSTSGSGTGLLLNVVASTGSGLTLNIGIQSGDGTLTITTWYMVADND